MRVAAKSSLYALLCGWLAVFLTGGVPLGLAQTLSPDPVFVLNAQTHTGFALNLAVSPDERQVITGGFDKTIRVWDAATGQALRRFHLPLRDGEDGSIESIDLSPDGERLAIGGHIAGFGKGLSVLVMSLRDGRILKVISGFTLSGRTVKWSPDGRLLAVGTDGRERPSRLHVFETQHWNKVFEEQDIQGRIEVIEFRRDGRFFAATNNGVIASEVFLYQPTGNTFTRLARVSIGQRSTWRGSWTADEKNLYINGHSYFSGDDLTEPFWVKRGQRPAREGFNQLRESPDGRYVFAAPWHRSKAVAKIRRYDDRSLRTYQEVDIPEARVSDFAVLKNGQLVYLGQEGSVAALAPDLTPMWRHSAPSVSFRGAPARLRVSADGRWVTLPLGGREGERAGEEERSIAFDLYEPRFSRPATAARQWIEPLTTRRGMDLQSWSGTWSGSINGNDLPRVHGRERTWSASVHSADPALVIGTSTGRLRKVDGNGKLLWTRYLASEVTAVNLIEASGLVVAATEDGFLRLFRWEDGSPVISYYLQPAAKKWLAVSSTGHYQASVGAEDLAGWVVNRGPGNMADFFPLSRFRERYLLPGVAAAALDARDGRRGVEALLDRQPLAQKLTPAERQQQRRDEQARLEAAAKRAEAALWARFEQAEREAAGDAIADAIGAAGAATGDPVPEPAAAVPQAALPAPTPAAGKSVKPALPTPVPTTAPPPIAAARPATPATPLPPLVRPTEQVALPAAPRVEQLPPAIDLLSPGFDTELRQPTLAVSLRVRSPDGVPVTGLRSRVSSASQSLHNEHPLPAGNEIRLTFILPKEDAELQLVAENRFGRSVPVTIRARYVGPAEPVRQDKPVLHVLAVGVSEYDNPQYRLGLAAKDAKDFSQLLSGQGGKLYERVELTVLTDQQAGKRAVEAALAGLQKKVRPQDATFVFLAGHGVNDGSGEYLYLPREADIARLRETGVSFRLLRQTLASLPGRTLMFVDTCHAGNAIGGPIRQVSRDNTAAINELAAAENNIIVFASSTGNQESLELAEWGNGAFTKALVEGFRGAADFKKRGRITYKQLDAYVSDRVDELTSGKQTPVTPVLISVPDFPLAEVAR